MLLLPEFDYTGSLGFLRVRWSLSPFVLPWVTTSRFLMQNRETELKLITFTSLLLFRLFSSSLFSLPSRARHRDVVLTRLRIGLTRLKHGHLISRSDPPYCPSCHVPIFGVHFLVDSTRYASLRRSLFPSLRSLLHSWRFSLVLAQSPTLNWDALFAFLTRSALLLRL